MFYFLKRILLFVPTLVLISFLAFGLNQCTPGDVVEDQIPASDRETNTFKLAERYENRYQQAAEKLGADLPPFYFSISNQAFPDTLHRILFKSHRKTLTALVEQSGNWPTTEAYYLALKDLYKKTLLLAENYSSDPLIDTRRETEQLFLNQAPASIERKIDSLTVWTKSDSVLQVNLYATVQHLEQQFDVWQAAPTRHTLYSPKIRWNGFQNQYQKWISSLLAGDLGYSLRYKRPVFDVIKDALRWTLLINFSAIFLAYLLSIPIGVYGAVYMGSRFDRWSSFLLFLLFSLPGFWMAILLAKFFTTPDWFNIFPSMGVGEIPSNSSFWEVVAIRAHHLFLPVFCMVYPSLAFLSRQVRSSMLTVLSSDYIRTAKAKGLSMTKVIWKHGFRNALFPLITMFGGILPATIAGSVLIEIIFTIPGMGKLMIDSILSDDWPIVYALLMITAVLTVLGLLLADILYTLSDPRVSFSKSQKATA